MVQQGLAQFPDAEAVFPVAGSGLKPHEA